MTVGFPVCCTFDLDLVHDEECRFLFEELAPAVAAAGISAATLFVRIDDQVRDRFGRCDHVHHAYGEALERLARAGWEIGWHPHCYRRDTKGRWQQNTDEAEIVAELVRNGAIARAHGMTVARMGWGFHTNRSVAVLGELGFEVDSSAIPRPVYTWERTVKNWEGAPLGPYRPSAADYRRPGSPALSLVEVPMSVAVIPASYDEGAVLRYLNPAYVSDRWRQGLEAWLESQAFLVTISHPDEFMPSARPPELLAHRLEVLSDNVGLLRDRLDRIGKVADWMTISAFAGTT